MKGLINEIIKYKLVFRRDLDTSRIKTGFLSMITSTNDTLRFPLPTGGALSISFQRTLRVPDTQKTYDLPAGLGLLPLRHAGAMLAGSSAVGSGIVVPMWQAEAMWICFRSDQPVAIKIGAGQINAVSGERWRSGLHRTPQDYVVAPEQPWLDGFTVEKGIVRQFVAVPLGSGATAEEEVTGEAEYGGLQIAVYCLTAIAFNRWEQAERRRRAETRVHFAEAGALYSRRSNFMGLGAGGRIKQHIFTDKFALEDWSDSSCGRVSVTILDALTWKAKTGEIPQHPPITSLDYRKAGIPWFRWYGDDASALTGSPKLRRLRGVGELLGILPGGNTDFVPKQPIVLGSSAAAVVEDNSL